MVGLKELDFSHALEQCIPSIRKRKAVLLPRLRDMWSVLLVAGFVLRMEVEISNKYDGTRARRSLNPATASLEFQFQNPHGSAIEPIIMDVQHLAKATASQVTNGSPHIPAPSYDTKPTQEWGTAGMIKISKRTQDTIIILKMQFLPCGQPNSARIPFSSPSKVWVGRLGGVLASTIQEAAKLLKTSLALLDTDNPEPPAKSNKFRKMLAS